jgi:3' exoribonuclease, RNase T-like
MTDDPLRFYFDTEFIEDGHTIDLISIGMVCEDGREYYAVNMEARLHRAGQWVRTNVLPHLPSYRESFWKPRTAIATGVRNFVLGVNDPPKVELWGYYCDYDWVALCQLFGTMIDLPKGFPMFAMDLKQLSVMRGSPKHPPQCSQEHHALADARWNRELHKFLETGKT